MLQKDQNRLFMWRSVLHTLDHYRNLWTGNAALTAVYDRLAALIALMEKAGTGQQAKTTGITADKGTLADYAIDMLTELAGAARAYAIDIDNNELYDAVNVTRRGLDYLTDNELRDKLESVYNAITPVAAQLQDAGVTPHEIADTGAAIRAYREKIAAPRTAISERTTHTQSIPEIKREVRKVLDKGDGLMTRFKRNAPAFATAYRSARVVIDNGTRHEDDDKGDNGDKGMDAGK